MQSGGQLTSDFDNKKRNVLHHMAFHCMKQDFKPLIQLFKVSEKRQIPKHMPTILFDLEKYVSHYLPLFARKSQGDYRSAFWEFGK